MKVKLIEVGRPDASGRVFSHEVLQDALDDIVESDGRMLVTLGGGMSMRDVCGQVVEMTLDDEALMAEIEILDTDAGKLVQQMMALPGGGDPFRSAGAARVEKLIYGEGARPKLEFILAGTVKMADDGSVKSMTLTGLDVSFESKG